MTEILKRDGKALVRIDAVEPGCWVNIYPPFDKEGLEAIGRAYDVPLDFLVDSLDTDERSRYEREEEVDLVVLNTPVANEGRFETEAHYITVPIGIISTPDCILTISAFENKVIDDFVANRIKNFDPADQSLFTLQLFNRNVYYFLYYLREINNKRYAFESELYSSSRNKELKNLLDLQKSLVYFVTNLRANELMMNKIKRMDFLKIRGDEEKEDFLDDIIIDNSQASEMSDIYTNIMNGTMDAFASIISNNLGRVVQRLTAVTIVLMVPTLVASFYGMNVHLPLEEHSMAFTIILVVSVVLSLGMGGYFLRNRWF